MALLGPGVSSLARRSGFSLGDDRENGSAVFASFALRARVNLALVWSPCAMGSLSIARGCRLLGGKIGARVHMAIDDGVC